MRKQYPDATKARELAKFIWSCVTQGQAQAPKLGYAPLPQQLQPWIQARLKSITAGGKAVWSN